MTSEREEAARYRAHKDDPEMWGTGEKFDMPHRKKGLSATITVRFSPEEADSIRRAAQSKSVSYSDIVREAVRAYTQPVFTLKAGYPVGVVAQKYSQPVSDTAVGLEFGGDFEQRASPTRSLAATG